MTTTTVINTVENETFATVYDGGNILVTSTGGYIDTSGDGLEFVSTSTAPIGVVTIEAGGFVFGNGNGIDFTGVNGNGSFLIDGTVQGNADGMNLTDEAGDTGSPNITIGSQGSVSGGTYGISIALGSTSYASITNHGTITGADDGIRVSASQVEITNTGTIDGIDIVGSSNPNYITNLGTIDGTFNVTSETSIENTGYIASIIPNEGVPPISNVDVSNSGTIGSLDLGNTSTVYNNGMIEGAISTGNNSYVVIGPQGSVEDYGYTAIYVGADSTVKNAGFVDGGTGTGVVAGGASDAILTNTGTILGGVNFSASSGDAITNDGRISGGITLGSGDGVSNSSTISGGISGDGGATIENSGLISGGITDSQNGDTIDNSGTIMGGISAANAFVTNSGTIHNGLSFTNSCLLDNSGLIVGSVTFAGSGDDVTNAGTIHGAVTLGATDSFTNDGIISSTLTLGTGDTLDMGTGAVTGRIYATTSDIFDFEGNFGHYRIADFATASHHDIIDFASDDFASYSELQSHMTQVGSNVVITLDASDDIILQNMKLANLVSHDFAFG